MNAPTEPQSDDADAAAFEAMQSSSTPDAIPISEQPALDEGDGQSIQSDRTFMQDLATRGLVLGWCIWLLGSWSSTLLIESTVPAARWMVFASVTGLMLLWPVIRLSQDLAIGGRLSAEVAPIGGPAMLRRHPSPRLVGGPGLALADWLALIIVFQAVIWPLRLSAGWSITQTIWLDGAIVAWSLLVAAIVAVGSLARRGRYRAMAMLLCVLLMFAEPAALALLRRAGVYVAWQMHVSPLQAIWGLSTPPVLWEPDPWRFQVVAVAGAALVAWLGAMLVAGRVRG